MKKEVRESRSCQNVNALLLLFLLLFLVLSGMANADVVVQGGTIDVDSKLFIDASTSNVGIGTITPGYKLHVQDGDIYSSAYVRGGTGMCIAADCRTSWPSSGSSLPSGTLGQTLRHDGTNWVSSSLLNNSGKDFIKIENSNEAYLALKNTEPDGREWALVSAGSLGGIGKGNFSIYDKTAGISRLVIDSVGNIGIGTTNPATPLHIKKSQNAVTYLAINNPYPESGQYLGFNAGTGIKFTGYRDIDSNLEVARIESQYASGAGNNLAVKGDLRFYTTDVWNSLQQRMIISTDGNVGIGTMMPGAALDVIGSIKSSGTINASCPGDMADVGRFCIEKSERGTLINWYNAIKGCGDIGRRLCLPSEWYYACNRLGASQLNQIDDASFDEWTDNRWIDDTGTKDFVMTIGYTPVSGSCKSAAMNTPPNSAAKDYRCCADKILSST